MLFFSSLRGVTTGAPQAVNKKAPWRRGFGSMGNRRSGYWVFGYWDFGYWVFGYWDFGYWILQLPSLHSGVPTTGVAWNSTTCSRFWFFTTTRVKRMSPSGCGGWEMPLK